MQIVDALIEALLRRGVTHVYGVPGDYVLGLFERLEASPIELICTAGEEGAGFAADVHARLHGLGVAVVTYGVGALKLLNPVAGAYVERSPLLVVSGAPGVRESDENDLLHHRMRAGDTQQRFFQEVTAESAVLDSARTAGAELLKVLRAMQRESRPGYLELPRDCLAREIPWSLDLAPKEPPLTLPGTLRRQGLEQLAWLRSRRSPVVLAGVEVARFGLQQTLLQLCEREGWPVATSLSGKGVVPERHPLCLGIYEGAMSPARVRERVEGSDGLVVLGMPFTDVDTGIFTMALEAEHCLQVDVDRGLRLGRLQNENLDPLTLLRIWTEAPGPPEPRAVPAPVPPAVAGPPSFTPEPGRAVTVTRLIEAIDASLPADGIVLADPGDALFGSAELHLQEASHHLSSGYWASLGFALPGAIGAWGARLGRLPVVLVGDGAFLMSCIELATLARYRIPALVIVLDNRGYGTERPMLDGPFNDVQPLDHPGLARAMGVSAAERVETEQALWESLQRWQGQRSAPVLLSVALPPGDSSPALQRLTAALSSRVRGPGPSPAQEEGEGSHTGKVSGLPAP
jgi:indolepyruvate decarboxylase